MADLALGAAKSVVEGTLAKVQLAIETEANLRQNAQSDLAFITEEFQMMQSFLDVVDEGRAKNKVVRTWVRQVRDLAYDVEDCMEFVAHLDPKCDWWRRCLLPCMALPLDAAVSQLKQLKARVEDVSNRNIRYNLISESGFKAVTQQLLVSSAGVDATTLDMHKEVTATNSKLQQDLDSLAQLITMEESGLRVIWVWGAGGDLGFMSIVRKAYTLDVCQIFPYRGWFKLTHPFNPHEVLRSLMTQFYTNSCLQKGASADVDELARMEETATTQVGLIKEFMKQVNEQRYLVVLENVSTMGEWDAIRTYLPDKNNGSLVIVSTQQREIASLCVGDSYQVLEMKQYSACALFKEGPRGKGDDVGHRCGSKSYNRMPTSKRDVAHRWKEQSTLIGRESEMNELRKCQAQAIVKGLPVMSVWGIPGVGKSTLARHLYYDRVLEKKPLFGRHSWVDVSHPFNLRDFCESLISELHAEDPPATGVEDPILECYELLKKQRCLVVIDNLQSSEEWDLIQHALVSKGFRSVIVVITNEASIATHCARSNTVINIKCLEAEDSITLFRKEVYQRNKSSALTDSTDPNVLELISKCGGIPKVIVAIADFLAPKTVTCMDSTRTLNLRFMHELESNTDLFRNVRGTFCWMDSFIRTCPDFLKRCLLYLSIIPQNQVVRRRRLVRRWIAESYCKDTEDSSVESRGEWSFSRLVDLSMIQHPPHSYTNVLYYRRMVRCQVNSFISGYIFSQPMEDNLVLELKGRCPLTTQRTGRHLVIDSSWDRDKIIYESIDFSRLRSLTVFGKWESFFISASMKVLRVLDLENGFGMKDKDLEKMLELLPRLKFLSLRGCSEIQHLPSSLGDLRQLETLDVRYTSIVSMPATINKLKKLQYIRAGTNMLTENQSTACSSSWLSGLCRSERLDGVKVFAGIEKLTALHTLGVVNVNTAGGLAILKEVKKLTQLRKLGVSGVNKKNGKQFCSTVSRHAHLESLSVRLSKGNQDCLDGITPPPDNLQSLKLFGLVKALPAWIRDLPKLRKLNLEITSQEVDIMGVLGHVKELSILRLCVKPLQQDNSTLHFGVIENGQENRCFLNLKILEIACVSSDLHVTFGSIAMQKLELLTARCCSGSTLRFSGLESLSKRRLKEVRLVGTRDDTLKVEEVIKTQLGEHPNAPSLKHQVEARL